MIEKNKLRDRVRSLIRAIPTARRTEASAQACSRLEEQTIWKQAKSVLLYAPTPDELDIWRLVQDSLTAGIVVALPRYDAAMDAYVACEIRDSAADIKLGRYGIREPAAHCTTLDLNRLDLILVPGVAFDLSGRRLGRGKGFYDRLLSLVSGTTCGVAYDEQIVPEIPVAPHDRSVNCILTPTRWIEP